MAAAQGRLRPGLVHHPSRLRLLPLRLRALVVAQGARSSVPKHQTWLALGHADSPDSPFSELKLSEWERNAGGAIGRRNYSYLSSPQGQHQVEVRWVDVFDNPTRPLVVDLGCGAGRYILLLAQRKGLDKNYLGLDVHKALLDRANGWAASRSLADNVHYMQANAVVSTGALLASYPGPVELVSIQYPDPQQRRQRHMVGAELVEALAAVLRPEAHVYLTSDFEDTAVYMRNAFERYGSKFFRPDDVHLREPVFVCTKLHAASPAPPFAKRSATHGRASAPSVHVDETAVDRPLEEDEFGEEDLLYYRGSWQQAGWLVSNPVGAPTEREVYVEKATKGKVYRVLLVRR